MIKVKFYDIGTIDDNKLLFAVIMAKFRGQWLYVRHRDRDTWEIPEVIRKKMKQYMKPHQEN